MVLMNSWNIEQYGTSVGDDFKMKLFKQLKHFMKFWYIE